MEAEHQDNKQSRRHVGVSVSCQTFLAINSKCIQTKFSPYVSPASLLCTQHAKDTLIVFAHHGVGGFQPPFRRFCCFIPAVTARRVEYRARWFELVRLHFQHVHTATTILIMWKPLPLSESSKFTLVVWRIITRKTIFTVVRPSAFYFHSLLWCHNELVKVQFWWRH